MTEAAPYLAEIAEGPRPADCAFVTSEDGLRLRVTFWRPKGHAKGTVLLFPGRTEFAEKYGRVAKEILGQGYACATIDWRGQGASERLSMDPLVGHVAHFRDYQRDVRALVDWVRARHLPEPWFLIAHSMGGCIGLRALIEGLPVKAAVFSAPMWGILIAPYLKPVAMSLPWALGRIGRGETYVPGTAPTNYVLDTAFEDNLLTTDPDHYAYLARHARKAKKYGIGGPSVHWLGQAMSECRSLARLPRPGVPVLTICGSNEGIVDLAAIRRLHGDWPSAALSVVEGGKHELMMEAPELRKAFFDQAFAHFDEVSAESRSA